MTADPMNFVKLALENGGSVHPLTIPSQDLKGPSLMNPSVYVDEGKILVNLRNINYTLYHSEKKKFEHHWGPLIYIHPENDLHLRTWNIMCEMDENMRLKRYNRVDTSKFPDKELWDFVGLEDARIIKWEGKLYLCGVRRDLEPTGSGRMELCEIEIGDNYVKQLGQIRMPTTGDDNSYCEKNWMPINDMPYHFLKWTNGTEVVKYDLETKKTTTVVLKDWKDVGCIDLRGGSQVIRLNEKYRFCLNHETFLTKSPQERKDGVYRHRFVIFDNDWNLVKVSKRFSFLNGEIEFAVGMTEYKNDYLITFGFQDNASFLVRAPKKFVHEYIELDQIEFEEPVKEETYSFEGYPTLSLEGHVSYTNGEWCTREFYTGIVDYLKEKKIESFLDVGGCTGEVVKILSQKIPSLKSSIILEPVSKNFDFIQERFIDDYNVKIIKKALYYGQKTISLAHSDGNVGGYSVNHTDDYIVKYDDIPTITLEELPQYDFIKIDIEGAERNVLENSSALKKFKYIAIEFHFEMVDTWDQLIKEYLPSHKIVIDGRKCGNPESVLLELVEE